MRLDDGFATLVELSNAPTIKLWEKTVTPPGIDGGGEVNTTTMHNDTWRTRSPKKLKTATEINMTCAYDSAVYPTIIAQTNQNQEITVTFPDGATLKVWGWINEFAVGEHAEGEQPEADVTIIISNQNNSGNEVAPVYTAPVTTTTGA